MLDNPSEPLQHSMIDELFSHFDAESGQFKPKAELRARFPS